MRKTIYALLLMHACVFSLPLAAQNTQNAFMKLAEKMAVKMGIDLSGDYAKEQFSEYCTAVLEQCKVKNEKTRLKAAPMRKAQSEKAHTSFVDRPRFPDLSQKSGPIKYYYIKNVKTGEYLHFTGTKSALTTVKVPNDSSAFYFINTQLLGGNNTSFYNKKAEDNVFYGPKSNLWDSPSGLFSDWSKPAFYFNVMDDNSGFYISNESYNTISIDGSEAERGDVWRYDPETKTVVIGELDEYAAWIAEPFTVAPQTSTDDAPIWYVARNVENGKYLHYEGANAAMTTVTSPDSCSLFYATQSNGDILLHNYTAGSLIYNGPSSWNNRGSTLNILPVGENNQFYISHSGDIQGNDILGCNANGSVGLGVYGDNTLWTFERITNFKEIFGFSNNGDGNIALNNVVLPKIEEMLDADYVTMNQALVTAVGMLVAAFSGMGSHMDIEQVHTIKGNMATLETVFTEFIDPKMLKEIRLYNTDYLNIDETTGKIKAKSLATNGVKLIVNDIDAIYNESDSTIMQVVDDAEHLHANMWQFWINGVEGMLNNNESLCVIIYNTATQKYISRPAYDEEGNLKVGMTSDRAKAGRYGDEAFSGLDIGNVENIEDLYKGYAGSLALKSLDVNDLYLHLASADDLELTCTITTEPDTLPGVNWAFVTGTSVLDEEHYEHASEFSDLYPELLQTQYGLVQNGCDNYSSNYPSSNPVSSTCNLTDKDNSTVFWTETVNGNEEKHYIQADLGEDNGVSAFYFYMRPNFESVCNVPMTVTVEGSNTPEGGFVTLVSDIEMPFLLYNMYYFSDLLQWDGTEYRYLRFTINSVNKVGEGHSENEFSLSEFYLFPDNEVVAQAKKELDGFYDEDYMGDDIVIPGAELMKRKAEYLLEINKDNHAVIPDEGQYPTAAYEALKYAYETVDVTSQESVDALSKALNEFTNSVNMPFLSDAIYMLESAWEDGFSDGYAFSVDINANTLMQESNVWDVRQWFKIGRNGTDDNIHPYYMEPFALCGMQGSTLPVNITKIPGWNTLYDSKKDAYNIHQHDGNAYLYLAADMDENGTVIMNMGHSPAATTQNQSSAWYLTNVLGAIELDYMTEPMLVEALADFGKTMALAKYYNECVLKGEFVYQENDGLTKGGFDNLFGELMPYYSLGPVEVIKMYASGGIPDSALLYINECIMEIKKHFPNFVQNVSPAGYYFRLRGRASGNYLLSDMVNGTLAMGAMTGVDAASDNAVAVKSVLYSLRGTEGAAANVLLFNAGRYLKSDGTNIVYDAYPLDENSYTSQNVYLRPSSNAPNDWFSVALNSDGTSWLYDNITTAVASGSTQSEQHDWQVELVTELPITVSSATMTSLCVPVELQVPDGVTAYILTGKDIADGTHKYVVDNTVCENGTPVFNIEQTELDIIPAGMPVLLKAAAGTYYFAINYDVDDAGKSEELLAEINELRARNKLEGTHDARLISERAGVVHHILSVLNEKVGMYQVNMVSAENRGLDYVTVPTFINQAHRAWLPHSGTSLVGCAFAIGRRDNGTTAIENVETLSAVKNDIFDLQGRRVINITSPGIYIKNGKKVFIK